MGRFWRFRKQLVSGFLLVLAIVCAACSARVPEVREDTRLAALFADQAVKGCFVLYDPQASAYVVYNAARAKQHFLPASTFKILNSLIALEEGAVPDTETVISWNGTDYGWSKWNQDHTMRSAMACSAILVYQEFARRIGSGRMGQRVREAGYGNGDIGGNLDSFWLDGALRISAMEQVAFLRRLHDNMLPFSPAVMQSVRDILLQERTDAYSLYFKTGWAQRVTPQTGWQVGWLQKGRNVYYFALNIDVVERKDAKARDVLMREGLRTLGLL